MCGVSGMLLEFYKANVAKAPKNQSIDKFWQTSPTSAETHEPATIAAIATNGAAASGAVAIQPPSKSTISNNLDTVPKNLNGGEMMFKKKATGEDCAMAMGTVSNKNIESFHPRIRITKAAIVNEPVEENALSAVPTSVVVTSASHVPNSSKFIPHNATTAVAASVIKPVPALPSAAPVVGVPQAAVIAAALLRDGYHNFQQQLRAQELLKHQQHLQKPAELTSHGVAGTPTKILESILLQQQHQQQQQQNCQPRLSKGVSEAEDVSDTHDGYEEDDMRFDDIHLDESGGNNAVGGASSVPKSNSLPHLFHNTTTAASTTSPGNISHAPSHADYLSDDSQKAIITARTQAMVLRNLEYSLGDFHAPGLSGNGSGGSAGSSGGATSPYEENDGEQIYECRHCGKKYRWKSTLRRHENVECGGKEPSHQCPYCPYKSKQRGNLGVHVRKHHSNLPQLISKRRSKYSQRLESDLSCDSSNFSNTNISFNASGNASDDSTNKLIIDNSK